MWLPSLELSYLVLISLATRITATANSNGGAQDQKPLDSQPLGGTAPKTTPPNIIIILSDDQDLLLDSLHYTPRIKDRLIDQGTLYQRHFCTTAVCCPSRASLWTGKLAHNTNVTDLRPPYGMDFTHLYERSEGKGSVQLADP